MQQIKALISAHTLEPMAKPAVILEFPEKIQIRAGQFILAALPGDPVPTRSRLFPIMVDEHKVTFDHLPTASWHPGREVDLIGPLGNHFKPPAQAGRWLCISLGLHPERLFPLLQEGKGGAVSIAFWSEKKIPNLPLEIERPVNPMDAIGWADFIAVERSGKEWPEEYRALRASLMDQTTAATQVLIDVPTPCGLGLCQTCAIPSGKSWSLACQCGLVHTIEVLRG